MKKSMLLLLALVASFSPLYAALADGWQGHRHHGHYAGDWHRGYWHHGYYGGHLGWWWVVGASWFLFSRPMYPYPGPYETPVMVVPSAPMVVSPVPAAPALPANPTSAPYVDPAGRTCREYQTNVVVGGQNQSAYGTACRQADGSWQVVR